MPTVVDIWSAGLYHVPMNTDHSTKGQPGEDVGQPAIPGCPTQTRRLSVGHPGIISEYSWLSHI